VSTPKQGAHVTQTGATPSTRKCFICGKVGCMPSTCDQPCDEAKIKRNAEAWRKDHPLKSDTVQKKREEPGGRRCGKHDKDEHGRILMKNKHGAHVVDQKVLKLKEAREQVEKDADLPVTKKALLKMTEKLKKLESALTATAESVNSSISTMAPSSVATEVTQQVHDARAMIAALTHK
jgi:hypothetical protein